MTALAIGSDGTEEPDSTVPAATGFGSEPDLFARLTVWLELDFPSSLEPVMTSDISSTNPDKQ